MIEEVLIQEAELRQQLHELLDRPAPGQPLVRVKVSLSMINLFGWLSRQTLPQRVYWQDRESDYQMAGLGRLWEYSVSHRAEVAECFASVRNMLPEDARCPGYLSFSDSESMVWPSFGYGCFFFPVIEIVQTRKGCHLVCNLLGGDSQEWQKSIRQALDYLNRINWQQEQNPQQFVLLRSEFLPDYPHWLQLINRALSGFADGEFQKVVLSRETRLGLKGKVNPWSLLQQWQMANPRSYVFAFEANNQDLFFGCSPERLFSRVDRAIHTEALAGTTRRGKCRDEDFELELRLLNDSKNIHENHLVLDDIRQRLNTLCEDLEFDRSHSIVKLNTIQHLRHLIRGVLKEDVQDSDLFSLLHPTPAVGGSGREEAVAFIEQQESYGRGLYAGACGVIGHKRTEFTVSIRSALLKAEELSLFAGAGIVQGSDAREEWQELNNKITTVLSLLNAAAGEMDKTPLIGRVNEVSYQAS